MKMNIEDFKYLSMWILTERRRSASHTGQVQAVYVLTT